MLHAKRFSFHSGYTDNLSFWTSISGPTSFYVTHIFLSVLGHINVASVSMYSNLILCFLSFVVYSFHFYLRSVVLLVGACHGFYFLLFFQKIFVGILDLIFLFCFARCPTFMYSWRLWNYSMRPFKAWRSRVLQPLLIIWLVLSAILAICFLISFQVLTLCNIFCFVLLGFPIFFFFFQTFAMPQFFKTFFLVNLSCMFLAFWPCLTSFSTHVINQII